MRVSQFASHLRIPQLKGNKEFDAIAHNRPKTIGKVHGTFAVGSRPLGVAFDGANIRVTNSESPTVSKL